jgi:hypothetical protein
LQLIAPSAPQSTPLSFCRKKLKMSQQKWHILQYINYINLPITAATCLAKCEKHHGHGKHSQNCFFYNN